MSHHSRVYAILFVDYMVQSVEPGREGVHIDIETDDVEAEVSRLERLGAKKRNS